MPTFLIVIREFNEYEFVGEHVDAQAARDWAEDVQREDGCDLQGYEISVRQLPLAIRHFEKE